MGGEGAGQELEKEKITRSKDGEDARQASKGQRQSREKRNQTLQGGSECVGGRQREEGNERRVERQRMGRAEGPETGNPEKEEKGSSRC